MFKQHLEMIGRNESPSKKAKFWQSYVRSLKGTVTFTEILPRSNCEFYWNSYLTDTLIQLCMINLGSDDIRAHDSPKINSWRPLSSDLPLRSIYDEPSTASERVTGVGYRYLPVHRETYGYSPRPIYSHHYGRPSKWLFCTLFGFVIRVRAHLRSLARIWPFFIHSHNYTPHSAHRKSFYTCICYTRNIYTAFCCHLTLTYTQ